MSTRPFSKLLKLMAFGLIGTTCGLAYYQLTQINEKLGTEIIDTAEHCFRQESQYQLNNPETKKNIYQSMKFKLYIETAILQQRLGLYANRLIFFGKYEEVNRSVIKEVIQPVLSNYHKSGVFNSKEIIKEFGQQGNFNNKMTQFIMKIGDTNSRIKEQKKGYIKDVADLQNKLMTFKLLQLTEEQKQQIDLLYEYINNKNHHLSKLVAPQNTTDQQNEVPSCDYLSKLQLL